MSKIRIVSGAQTGADLAALDIALELGLECGGWVPKGRTNEAGVISPHYPDLKEAPSVHPDVRTELNVRDSDVTLIVSHGPLSGGSLYTLKMTEKYCKPVLHIDLEACTPEEAAENVRTWLASFDESLTLNVAGPRASEDPLIYEVTRRLLELVLGAYCD